MAAVPPQIGTFLRYYKRREVQEAIVRHAQDREVSPRYGEGFGKRPDVLSYPADVLSFATKKTTSFHVSEERWNNPLLIQTGMPRKELDKLRSGWDLVLDIDAKDWEISRITAFLFVEALKRHGIGGISAKFSGNKGWHIGVPFESFPPVIFDPDGNEFPTKDLFPELPRAVAAYLISYIGDPANDLVRIEGDKLVFGGKIRDTFDRFAERVGKTRDDLFERFCTTCNKVLSVKEQHAFACPNPGCAHRSVERYSREEMEVVDDAARVCPKCGRLMNPYLVSKSECVDKKHTHITRFRIDAIVEIDTVLLASRHLYRMAYSLHEKSGLASVPIDHDDILKFKKEDAQPGKITFERTFLDPNTVSMGEASDLAHKAWAAAMAVERKRSMMLAARAAEEIPTEAIPEELFPPCMKKILLGLQDGKKRAMFALTNFLTLAGWSPEMIELRLNEWNKVNPEPLREVILNGHMRTVRMKRERFPPPSCRAFYQELGVCFPDDMCNVIKNPVQYAKRKASFIAPKKTARKKEVKTNDQPPANEQKENQE